MFTLTARRAPRFCGRIWTPTASVATLPPSTSGWQTPFYTGVAAARHASNGATSPGPVRFVDTPRKISKEGKKYRTTNILKAVTPAPKTEAWYDYFLYQVTPGGRNQSRKPPYRYQSLVCGARKPNLPEALQQNPLAVFDNDHTSRADNPSVNQCLELYIRQILEREGASNVANCRKCYMRDTPGSKALLWSTSLPETDRQRIWGDHSFLFPVIHCLVAENNLDALWHWLSLDKRFGPRKIDSIALSEWKNDALRFMVEAQVHWTDSTNFMADAIAMIVKARDMKTSTEHMPIRAAMKFVFRVMKKTPAQNSDLYDRFMALVPVSHQREDERDYILATLHIRHPSRPDASKMMQILRSDQAHVQRWLRPSTYQAGVEVIFTMCALAQRCLAEGKVSDAKWVMDNAYDRAPYLFSGAAALQSFKTKTEAAAPALVVWTPSQRELEKGVTLDKDGKLSPKETTAFQYPSRKWTT